MKKAFTDEDVFARAGLSIGEVECREQVDEGVGHGCSLESR